MTRRITLTIAAAITAFLLSAGLAAAQEPPDADSGTRLEPGLNLVGWVGEPTPVSQLFQQIPRLEAIWAWDAELRDWIVAAPGAPDWLGGLGRVTAGMGLRMQLGGDQPYLWRRSTEPTRGLVKLRTGWNLVAWSGADGAAIGDVVKGIGWSLRTVRRWDAANQQWVTWTSPERSAQVIANTGADQDAGNDAEMPGIRRGEALWIEVARAVNWLQPTEILPRLVFPGGASQELQTRVREDLQATLSFFRDQYGIQAEPSYTVYVPRDIESLLAAFEEDGIHVDDSLKKSHQSLWDGAHAWGGDTRATLKQSLWESDVSDLGANPRYILTHEYTHALHGTLADRASVAWLREGTAHWAAHAHSVADQSPEGFSHPRRIDFTIFTPTLSQTEDPLFVWEYDLGWLATDRLTAVHGRDSWIEFYRRITSTQIGPEGQWQSVPSWRAAFHDTFGLSIPEFYADSNAWRHGKILANADRMRRVRPEFAVAQWIFGSVIDASGSPVGGIDVSARRVEGGIETGWQTNAGTAADGTFALGVHEAGNWRLRVVINDDCTRYWSNGALVEEQDDASLINVAGADVANIDIQLLPNVCGLQIRGRVVGPNDEPLEGLGILACRPQKCHTGYAIGTLVLDGAPPDVSFATQYVATAPNGSFTVTPGLLGVYLRLVLNDTCSAWYTSTGLNSDRGMAATITVDNGDSKEVSIQVPSWMCRWQIRGRVAQADGRPLADTYISACLEVDGDCVSRLGGDTDDNGSFAITVPAEGKYRLSFKLEGCTVYFASDGLTANWQERLAVRVEGRDASLRPRQIPAGMCAHRISGRFVDSGGVPLSETWINVRWPGGAGGAQTDPDGRFEIPVPSDGGYYFSVQLRQQPECWAFLDGQDFGSPNNPVRVSGADVTDITLRLPGTIEDLCE